VHDAGFGSFAERAGRSILARFRPLVPRGGLVVDLGCGSGTFARRLTAAGYAVLGVDSSAALLALARLRAPAATFLRASFLDLEFPPCHAVTALGEVLNYRFDPRNDDDALFRLFRRIHAALRPGGLLAFDLAGPRKARGVAREAGWKAGSDWAVLFEKEANGSGRLLTRRITTFRKVGRAYRRSEEVHRLRLYPKEDVAAALERAGFQVRTLGGYGPLRLGPGLHAFVARKPSRPSDPSAAGLERRRR
jgi:SAM-dependent methyltransferase